LATRASLPLLLKFFFFCSHFFRFRSNRFLQAILRFASLRTKSHATFSNSSSF
jgi:hypothetical protein